MSKERLETSRSMEPFDSDDLKLINGIGPAVEHRLHGVSIYTYAQLAILSPADLAAAVAGLAGLSAERIIKQNWISQARKLASKSISSKIQEEVNAPAEPLVPPVVAPPYLKEDQVHSLVVAITEPIGVLRLSQIETVLAGAHTPQNFFAHDQPFNVHLTLDFSNVRVHDNTQFSYIATIYSKSLEGLPHQAVGETSGIITSTHKVTVSVEGLALPKEHTA